MKNQQGLNPWQSLIESVKRHEGLRLTPYRDSEGKLTVGYGRNLDDNGISESEAEKLLEHDLVAALQDITSVFPEFEAYSEPRKTALADMMFNLSKPRFLGFTNMIIRCRKRRLETGWSGNARQPLGNSGRFTGERFGGVGQYRLKEIVMNITKSLKLVGKVFEKIPITDIIFNKLPESVDEAERERKQVGNPGSGT